MCGPYEDEYVRAKAELLEEMKKIHRTDPQVHRAMRLVAAFATFVDDYEVDDQLSRLGFGVLRAKSKARRKDGI